MSRTEPHEFEFPSGLGALRSMNDRTTSLNGFTPTDRRPSLGLLHNFSKYSQESDNSPFAFAANWSLAPNKQIPATLYNSQLQQHFIHHQQQQTPAPPSPPSPPANLYLNTLHYPNNERDLSLFRPTPHLHAPSQTAPQTPSQSFNSNASSLSTLWWGELEPWMDEEYAKRVCGLMGWDPVTVKVPHSPPDPTTGQQPNNPGYCFLTFPTMAQASSVLSSMHSGGNMPPTMPNSTKPFVLNWASSVQSATPVPSFPALGAMTPQQQYPKEYSIFVGDLAPETSNSDLVAVFRNPVLGLRNDREPKFIRPFLSCKSAKIMLDPVTGVSRGYGFVRFTDERDQQRALIEMHGLYCLSRPMRISPATAKFKAPTAGLLPDASQLPFASNGAGQDQFQPVTIALPLSNTQAKSVSAPMATTSSSSSLPSAGSVPSLTGSNSTNSLPSGTTGSSSSIASSAISPTSSDDALSHHNVLVQLAQQYANGNNGNVRASGTTSITAPFAQDGGDGGAPKYTISEESWKHHAQARAILGNLIGPNGEQLTSTDPYNTTVFVGGLSPLISEDTLRTFFAPFGDIHYVKVPAGKHCGFVQFVRKADAERAIEKMQGFPVGGSRIRLSWGRSQYKAAQAAAQAAQAAALQAQYQSQFAAPFTPSVTPEQAMELLQKFGIQLAVGNDNRVMDNSQLGAFAKGNGIPTADQLRPSVIPLDDPLSYDGFNMNGFGRPLPNPGLMGLRQNRSQTLSNFSPFSPDPNLFSPDRQRPEPVVSTSPDPWPHHPKNYSPGFGPSLQDPKIVGNTSGKISPPSGRPLSGPRYNSFLDGSAPAFQMNQAQSGHSDGAISRPSSGQTTGSGRGYHGVEHDVIIQDLNGTLASLNLDQTPDPWKSPSGSPAGHNSSSGEAVAQHELGTTSKGRAPSP